MTTDPRGVKRGGCLELACECTGYMREGDYTRCGYCHHAPTKHACLTSSAEATSPAPDSSTPLVGPLPHRSQSLLVEEGREQRSTHGCNWNVVPDAQVYGDGGDRPSRSPCQGDHSKPDTSSGSLALTVPSTSRAATTLEDEMLTEDKQKPSLQNAFKHPERSEGREDGENQTVESGEAPPELDDAGKRDRGSLPGHESGTEHGIRCRRCHPPRRFSTRKLFYKHAVLKHKQKPLLNKHSKLVRDTSQPSTSYEDTDVLEIYPSRPSTSLERVGRKEVSERRQTGTRKSFECIPCGKTFTSCDDHKRHAYEWHGDTTSGRPCPTCEEWFTRPSFLERHRPMCPQLLIREGKLLDEERRSLQCSQCRKTFTAYENLIKHKKLSSHFYGENSNSAPSARPTLTPPPRSVNTARKSSMGLACSYCSKVKSSTEIRRRHEEHCSKKYVIDGLIIRHKPVSHRKKTRPPRRRRSEVGGIPSGVGESR